MGSGRRLRNEPESAGRAYTGAAVTYPCRQALLTDEGDTPKEGPAPAWSPSMPAFFHSRLPISS